MSNDESRLAILMREFDALGKDTEKIKAAGHDTHDQLARIEGALADLAELLALIREDQIEEHRLNHSMRERGEQALAWAPLLASHLENGGPPTPASPPNSKPPKPSGYLSAAVEIWKSFAASPIALPVAAAVGWLLSWLIGQALPDYPGGAP